MTTIQSSALVSCDCIYQRFKVTTKIHHRLLWSSQYHRITIQRFSDLYDGRFGVSLPESEQSANRDYDSCWSPGELFLLYIQVLLLTTTALQGGAAPSGTVVVVVVLPIRNRPAWPEPPPSSAGGSLPCSGGTGPPCPGRPASRHSPPYRPALRSAAPYSRSAASVCPPDPPPRPRLAAPCGSGRDLT